MGIAPAVGEISKGLVERVGSLSLAFLAFHRPGISTALFLRLFCFGARPSFVFALAFCLLILLGVLDPVTWNV